METISLHLYGCVHYDRHSQLAFAAEYLMRESLQEMSQSCSSGNEILNLFCYHGWAALLLQRKVYK